MTDRAAVLIRTAAIAALILANTAAAPAGHAQTATALPPPQDPLCAPFEEAWRKALADGDVTQMQQVAASIPVQCPIQRQAQIELQSLGAPDSAAESSAPNPGEAPRRAPSPPGGGDPMSGIPASHKSDQPPPQ